MDFKESRDGGVIVLAPVGSLDTQTSPELEERLDRLTAEARRTPAGPAAALALVLNFREVEFVSSAGLRVLLRLAKRLDRHKGRLALCALNDNVQQAFDICGFTRHFTITSTLAEAAARVAVPQPTVAQEAAPPATPEPVSAAPAISAEAVSPVAVSPAIVPPVAVAQESVGPDSVKAAVVTPVTPEPESAVGATPEAVSPVPAGEALASPAVASPPAPQRSEADLALEEAARVVGSCLAGDEAAWRALRARVSSSTPLEGVDELISRCQVLH